MLEVVVAKILSPNLEMLRFFLTSKNLIKIDTLAALVGLFFFNINLICFT